MKRNNWTRDELILALCLYYKTPFGKIHTRNTEIIELASLIGRTPSAVSYKLVNFASLDSKLSARGIKGMTNSSKSDVEIWNEFHENWEKLPLTCELIKQKYTQENTIEENFKSGIDKIVAAKTRINQDFFRQSVLASYLYKCAITGISNTSLLIASHIVPWSKDELNRTNPSNGICLNALHDKAFDKGLITIDYQYRIVISKKLEREEPKWFQDYHGKMLTLPEKFLPEERFLKYHNENVFINE
jgi:putative restriction endonuclease